jgi:hypothetical protein
MSSGARSEQRLFLLELGLRILEYIEGSARARNKKLF